MSEPRHHHYVPQCYLRNFAIDEQVHVFNSKSQKLFRAAIRNIAGERDLYRLEGGKDPQLAEKAFGQMEAHIAPILTKIISDQELPPKDSDELISLLSFISTLFVRHPGHIQNIEGFMARVTNMSLDLIAQNIPAGGKTLRDGQVVTREKAIEAVKAMEEGRIKLHIPRDHGVSTSLSSVEKLTETLMSREWCLVVAGENSFVTSSKPVMLLWDELSMNLKHSPGFGLTDTTVYFAISPTLMMVGKFASVKTKCILDLKGVAGMNGLHGFCSPHFLISQNEDSFIQLAADLTQFKDLEAAFKKINSKDKKL